MTGNADFEIVVDRVAEMLHEDIGLRPDPSLRGRLRRAIRETSIQDGHDPAAYLDTLVAGSPAVQHLLNRITVQETAFFRHREQFDVLARDILPDLPRPVTIWSAGCANGQEAYTLAMLLDERGIDGRVIATDLSTAALARTCAARYTERELTGLSAQRIARHLRPIEGGWEVVPGVRDRVSTQRHNLLDPLPDAVRSSRVVFCRNVLIYLTPAHARAFLDRVADALPDTTALFVGAAETIWQVSDRFKAVPVDDTFIYRRATAPAAPVAATPVRPARPALPARRAPPSRRAARPAAALPAPDAASSAVLLAMTGQEAVASGDYAAAVVAFRKCAYLVPNDPVAQLHLGLALDAAGDHRSAQRAYAAARGCLLETDREPTASSIEGYATSELLVLLDAKQRVVTR